MAKTPERVSTDMANVHKTNMFLAQELNRKYRKFFRQWDAKELALDDIREAVEGWFDNLGWMRSFLTIINRAEDRHVDLLGNRTFQRNLRIYIYMDAAQRFKNMGEILSMLAWLVGEDRDKGVAKTLEQMSDVLGL